MAVCSLCKNTIDFMNLEKHISGEHSSCSDVVKFECTGKECGRLFSCHKAFTRHWEIKHDKKNDSLKRKRDYSFNDIDENSRDIKIDHLVLKNPKKPKIGVSQIKKKEIVNEFKKKVVSPLLFWYSTFCCVIQ